MLKRFYLLRVTYDIMLLKFWRDICVFVLYSKLSKLLDKYALYVFIIIIIIIIWQLGYHVC